MKKLFLVFFLFVSLSIISFGANTFILQYIATDGSIITTHSITRGGASAAKVRLKINNTSGVTAGEYVFRSYQIAPTGLYIKNHVANVGTDVVTLDLNPSSNQLTIHVQNTSATSIDVDMDIWAGQCFGFEVDGPNTKTLDVPFSLLKSDNSTLVLAGNNSISINKGSFLNYIESVPTIAPDVNKVATFSYILLNNSGSTFNGNVSFQESGVGTAYDIRKINFYQWNGSVWTLIKTVTNPIINSTIDDNNNNFFTGQPIDAAVTILNNEKIKVEEIVQLNGCLQNTGANNSTPKLRWGNASYDMCAEQSLASFITPTPFLPRLTFTKTDGTNNYCYGSSTNLRSYTIKNEGNDVAKNVIFDLIAGGGEFFKNPFFVKYAANVNNNNDNIYLMINNEKYIVKLDKYNIDLNTVYTASNLPSFIPASILPPWTTNGYQLYKESLRNKSTRMIPVNCFLSLNEFIYFEQFSTVTQESFPFSTKCIGDFNTKLIKELYIDEIKRANSDEDFAPIKLNPGDVITLYWNEANCCFKNEALSPYFTKSQVLTQYDGLCGGIQEGFGREDISMQQKLVPAPSSGTTLGDVDRCPATSDGLVERISATIQTEVNGRIVFPDNYVPKKGKLVFRVYLQNGLDLDKSLAEPKEWGWTNFGYNNVVDNTLYVQNNPSECAGACNDPNVCYPNNIINNINDKYYVRLRPSSVGSGKFISPATIRLVTSDPQIQNTNVPLSGLTQPLNPDLIFANNSLYANQLYEVAFNIEDLINFYEANGGAVGTNKLDELRTLLEACILDFDVRAYCSVNGKPSYEVVMYHDRCSDAPSNYQPSSCDAGFTSMQPISSFGNSFIVNCPGCKIPGANIEISSLTRAQNSRGLVDYNGDRLPDNNHETLPAIHPTLKNVAMGDEMEARFMCYMSDGEQLITGQGISKTELNAAAVNNDNLYLDNFMINGIFSGGALSSGPNKNIEIISLKMTYKNIVKTYNAGDAGLSNVLFHNGDASFIIRANVKDFIAIDNSFDVGSVNGITFELVYQIGDMGSTVIIPEITYAPYYSPCDDCNSLIGMTEVNPASNTGFSPFTLAKLIQAGGKTLWKCSGFSNKFKFIPYQQVSSYRALDNNCTKGVTINFSGNFNSNTLDFFVDEYRTFLESDLKTETLIPNGYLTTKIQIDNKFKVGGLEYTERYEITDPNIIVDLVHPNLNNLESSAYCGISTKFNGINQFVPVDVSGFSAANRTRLFTNIFPDGSGATLIRGDEYYSVQITVTYTLDPTKKCSEVKEYKQTNPYFTTSYVNRSNSPSSTATEFDVKVDQQISKNPHAQLHGISDYNVDRGYLNGSADAYIRPTANLQAKNLDIKRISISSTALIQIPIEISNDKINTWYTPNADYPYFQIYGDALTKGLKLIGIYQGNKNIALPTAANYYNEHRVESNNLLTEGIIVGIDFQAAHVRNPLWNPDPILTPGPKQYTLVFENTCPENCFQNLGCGTSNTLPANCLFGDNNLQIAYGWSCGSYPTFQALNENKTCGEYVPIDYTVNIAPVGLTVNASLNGNAVTENQILQIEPCNVNNAYKITLNSCKEVGFNEFEIEFSGISSEISIIPPTTAGPFVVTQDVSNAKLFHLTCSSCSLTGPSIDVNFIIKSSCKVVGESLRTTIRSKTFCTPTAVPYFAFNNPLQVKVNPATSIADQLELSSDNVTVVSGNYLNIKYSLIGAGNASTKFDNSILVTVFDGPISVYSETVVIPAGTPDGLVNKTLSLGISSCGTYRVVLVPQISYVPSCGLDANREVIPACKNIIQGAVVSKNVIVGNPIAAYITTIDGYASFICGPGSKVTFVAYPQTAGLTYAWSGPGITGTVATNTIDATIAGTYSVVVSDLCGSSTATATVVNSLQVVCPESICPGETPAINVVNFNGVVGTYKAQWYNPNGSDGNTQADLEADILMDKGIVTSGYYYAATVTPSCTLRTNARIPRACPIVVKRAPHAYHITSDRPSGDASVLFLCDGQSTVFSVTNKSVNNAFPTSVIWRNGQTTTDDITAPGTWTSPGNLLTAQELEKSDYFIVAIDDETKCLTSSNEIAIETPHVGIVRTCNDANGIKLTAVSNFNVMPDQYDWQFNGAPLVQGVNTVDALQAGVYTVIERSTGCTLSNKCWGIKENLNTSASSNQELLSLQAGSFEGISATQIPLDFDTEFLPLDRTGYTGAQLPADYTIGKFMINESGLQASDWSPNVPSSWVSTNTTYSGDGAMFIDGESEPAAKLIWGKTVPATHGLNYLYRFNVRNINLLTQYPVEEIPELYVQITYMDGTGNGTRYKSNKQALFNNGQSPWIEFSSYTPAMPLSILDCLSPSEIQTVRLELFMDGGGAIGRDIAIDDVSLIPIGICDDVITLDLPCNAALAEVDNNQLVICPGTHAQFNITNAPAGLTYQWQSVVNGILTTVGSDASFVTPELTLTDPKRPAFFNYQVTITDPVNHCQTKQAVKAIVSALPDVTITETWTGTNCEKKFVAVFDGLGTPSQFEWYVNNTLVSSQTTNTFIANFNKNDLIQSKVRNVWCSGAQPVVSNSIQLLQMGIQADAGSDKAICAGQSVAIGTVPVAGAAYSWLPATELNTADVAQPLFTPIGTATSGIYNLTLTDLSTGCTSIDEIHVVVNTLPNLIVMAPASVCEPSTVNLTATAITQGSDAGLTYTYFTDAGAATALVNPNAVSTLGIYYIQAENTAGCTAIKPVAVDVNPAPVVVITNPASVNFPATVDLTLSAITAGSTTGLSYSYYTDENAAATLTAPNAVAVSGTYYIKGSTMQGCSDMSSVEVSVEHPLSNKSLTSTMDVTLSPNPFTIQTYLLVSGANSDYVKITIVDMNGKVVFEDAYVSNDEQTAIGMDLSSAVYLLKIVDGEKIKIMKFVKL